MEDRGEVATERGGMGGREGEREGDGWVEEARRGGGRGDEVVEN